ncbi:hypothetical protein, partial [Aquabacterium sp.]|uniref:hypothetical protein n=1 Tax=Aquabacterium sp. TaxID=1872578 RepID=UPI0025C08093
ILPLLVGPVFAVVPDPTQARAADVDVRWTMTCDRGDVDAGGTVTHDRQRLHLVLEAAWRRADLLPFGLMNRENPPVGGDSAGYQVQPASELSGESWFLVTNEDPVDTLDGAVVGWYGATAPSEGLLPPGIIGGYTVAIEPSAIRDGHTIRASWLMAPSDPQDAEWPRIRGAYAHLDRFLLVATVGCGESAQAVEVPIWARLAR